MAIRRGRNLSAETVEVVAEERERRIVEKGGIGLALLDELLQLVQFRRLHFSLTLSCVIVC